MFDTALFDEIMFDDADTSGVPNLPQFPEVPNLMFPVIILPSFEVSKISYVNGSEQRILGTDEEKSNIKLRYRLLSQSDRNLIYNFFLARKGQTETFYWTDPITSLIHIIRFKEDSLNVEYFAYKLYHLNEVDLIEVYWRDE